MDSKAKIVCEFLSNLRGFHKLPGRDLEVMNIETGAVIKPKYSEHSAPLSADVTLENRLEAETLLMVMNNHTLSLHYYEVINLYLAQYALVNQVITETSAAEEFQRKLLMLEDQFREQGHTY